MDFRHSDSTSDLVRRVSTFVQDFVVPAEEEYEAQLIHTSDWKLWRQPRIMETLKQKAQEANLWNLFLPGPEGAGLTVLDYAPIAELMGRSPIASEVFNCNPPDSGNMELLAKYASAEQKARWLDPLLKGDIRSAFCMTEPDVASSDATNIQATAILDGRDVVLNGRKWWSSGIGHPFCKILIFMGVTATDADAHHRHSMVLVPVGTPGVKIERMLPVFGNYDEPFGHGEVTFCNVRVPLDHIVAGPGRGFEVAQGRLGPGRIHHCMRALGVAERALELMCRRSLARTAFGRPLADLGGNADIIAESRIALEQARLLTLKAAWAMDTMGAKAAMSEIAQAKVAVPNAVQAILDKAIQFHGGAGVSDDTPLAEMYANVRTLRLVDGPDEVHRRLIAKWELRKYVQRRAEGSVRSSSGAS